MRTQPRLKEYAYSRIKDMIFDGEIEPGELVSERKLAEQLNTSMTPVKYALQMLASENIVVVSPRRGSMVRTVSPAEVSDLSEIRCALEQVVIGKVVDRLTPELRRLLDENVSVQRESSAAGDVKRFAELDLQFHTLLYEHCGNPEIVKLMVNFRERLHLLFILMLKRDRNRMAASHIEHVGILRYLYADEKEAAVKAITQHVENGRRILLGL